MAAKLATVAGCSADELIITRNTTESLDLIISGLDWNAGDEAIMAEQDYGSMRNMFIQVSKRFRLRFQKRKKEWPVMALKLSSLQIMTNW